MKRLTVTALLALTLITGCTSSDPDIVPDLAPSQLYNEAQTELERGNWMQAIEKLEALDSRYPFGAYSEQVQLDLIFAYYKYNDMALAIATIDRFLALNPTHPNADWALYMRGLSNMALDSSFIHSMLNMERNDRDPIPVRHAFQDFKKLMKRYPNSQYTADAKARMIALKERLAAYELAVVDYYVRRGAWVAAANRGQLLLNLYPDTQAARDVLPLMERSYAELKLQKPTAQMKSLMQLNGL
ncbi:Outer membrane protein assembly factor BamD [Vibrio stylophorae]|uniref:Outer membrane protein assembly factor BamD n=1 Tax=Vibrio stylophorae TaxID=659351 RepID=A0ABM8ZVE9_9VIBR|nr:outer membrane protein assembly factor BamD [Vibrio stylophorae]CAH0534306.1 Outer membrane protein assembly factor BamD [Vibrio stylophorae]